MSSVVTLETSVHACPDYPGSVESLLDVLQYQAAREPDRIVCHEVTLARRGIEARAMELRVLMARASVAAAALRRHGVREGDRVILSLSKPHDFIVAFVGSLAAGAAAVPLPTIAEAGAPASFAARVRSVCADCGPRVAIVEDALRYRDGTAAAGRDAIVLEPSDLVASEGEAPLPRRAATDMAFIQYTSGSTGTPKGVVVTHGNILANCRAIRDATEYTRADRMVAWLPLHHDMGLVGGLLTSIYCAAETWIMPPMTFLGRPVTWLEALSKFAATLTVAPTFAYSLCARKLPDKQLAGLDLSPLRLAYIGAEPVDRETLDVFVGRFAPYGLGSNVMYPVYGLAEATLAAAFPRPGAPLRFDRVDRAALGASAEAKPAKATDPAPAIFVSVGHALPRHRIEIVSPATGKPVADRRIGELNLVGDSVTPGYFGDPAPARAQLATGDLAYVADGHVYIVDRIKDLVIVAGQSHAPSDIENAVATIDALRRGRIVAFSAPGEGGTELLHIVAEVSPRVRHLPPDLDAEVKRQVLRLTGLSVASVSVVTPGSLERTSSGKIMRRACRAAWQQGGLDVVRDDSDLRRNRRMRRRAALNARFSAWLRWFRPGANGSGVTGA